MHLYLVRHGQSYVNLPDWAKGNTDEPLTELGQKQAAGIGGIFAHAAAPGRYRFMPAPCNVRGRLPRRWHAPTI